MKTIGLIGGMSWESSTIYYQDINRMIQHRLGGFHSASIILYSVDFQLIETLQRENRWVEAAEYLSEVAIKIEGAGAKVVALCTNTMHKVADPIINALSVPFIHIADATIQEIKQQGFKRVALLGTRFTMEQDFYRERILQQGVGVIIPDVEDRESIHQIIYQELCKGKMKQSSKQKYLEIIQILIDQGAEAIILGCTEIGLLIQDEDVVIPIFDTTKIHVQALVDFALHDVEEIENL